MSAQTWDGVLIDSIIPGGPAWLAGKMHPGDVITHIRSVDVRGGTCTPQQVSIMLRSSPGTRLTLKISRGMLRETISVDVVRGHALDLGFVGAYRRALAAKVAVRSGMLDESIGGASSITHTHTSAPGSPLRTAARPSSKMSWGSVITGVGTTRGGIGGGWDPQALYGYGIRHGTLVNGGCVEVKDKDGMNGVSRSEIREVQICKGAANRTTSRREELMIQADQVQMEILTLERRLDQSFEALTRRVNAMESGPSTMEL